MRGRIFKGLGGLYEIRLENGNTVNAKARGSFRRSGLTPYVGDYVEVLTLDDRSSVIDEILERKNSLIRPPFANLDYLFVCIPTAKPEPAVTTIDKLISIAEYQNIEPIIIITKTDENSQRGEELASVYLRSGFRVFEVCAPLNKGLDEVKDFFINELKGGTAAFAGASGVGKTTLMNTIFPTLGLATGEISAKISRGKHTTRHVELYDLGELTDGRMNGFLADTPGFSMLDFVHFDFYDKDDLPYTFREFVDLIPNCRYTDCTHTKEEDCAVVMAVKNGKIPRSRHDSFLEIYNDVKNKKPWDNK